MKRPSGFAVSLAVLAGFHLLAIFAGFVAPYRFDTQDRMHPYAPPSRIHFVDSAGTFHLRPFIYALRSREDAPLEYSEDRSRMLPLRFFSTGEKYTVLGIFSARVHLVAVEGTDRLFLMGADGFGRDQLSRVLWGSQVSLFAGLLATVLAVGLGLLLGSLAGFHGGWPDLLLMRLAEVFMAVPWFYLLLALRALLPLQMEAAVAFILVVTVLGAVGWARPARLVRGVVLSARARNFVLAARGFGGSNAYVWRRHILPATLGVAATQLTLLVPQFIMAEAVLSFLGLGISEPAPSWGSMLAAAQQYHILVSYWWMLLPVLVPIPLFFTYQVFADRLQTRLQLDT
jgi:peptide/nickel transport system permease protein